MAVISGNSVGVYVGGTLIGCLTGATLTTSRTEIDVTCKDNSGDKAVILGGATTTISFNGNWNLQVLMVLMIYSLSTTQRAK